MTKSIGKEGQTMILVNDHSRSFIRGDSAEILGDMPRKIVHATLLKVNTYTALFNVNGKHVMRRLADWI